MDRQDLTSLLAFAKASKIMNMPFLQVFNAWIKDLEEYYEDFFADWRTVYD